MFEVKTLNGLIIHAGLMDNSAPGNFAIFPKWIMTDLHIDEGAPVNIKEVVLQQGKLATFQPLSKDFYGLKSPDLALQNILSNFTTLTSGQTFPIYEDNKVVLLYVVETKPEAGICIDTRRGEFLDFKCDFEPSIDTIEEKKVKKEEEKEDRKKVDKKVEKKVEEKKEEKKDEKKVEGKVLGSGEKKMRKKLKLLKKK